ncbi:ATP-binding protein, partial [Acinetobacter baumannii]
IDEFINPNFDISNLSTNDLVYPAPFNSWFKDYFDQDWIDKGGFVSTEKIKGGGEIVRYSTEKTHEIESGDFRIVNQIKFAIQQDRKRINFNQEWMSKIFFREFKALFTKSIPVSY